MERILPKGNTSEEFKCPILFLQGFKDYEEHFSHKMVITKINYKEPISFVIENSWGNQNSIYY
jgi:hypothetical protein